MAKMKSKEVTITCALIFLGCFCRFGASKKWYENTSYILPRREGKHIGYEQKIKIDITNEKDHILKTLSINPLLFEIEDFLSSEECEYIIYLAKNHGLTDSLTFPDTWHFKTSLGTFNEWDVNNDSFVDPAEFTYIKGKGDIYLTEHETMRMLEHLKLDKNGDHKMDLKEFFHITAEKIFGYFNHLYHSNPRLRSRLSKQTWLWHYGAYDTLLEGFHDRVSRLTMLPHSLVEMSEPIQVVEYAEHGHYHCHHDSEELNKDMPCCTFQNQNKKACRICRYLTLLIYLNKVTYGGETAFPVANNETFNYENWSIEWPLKCNLADNCDSSNVVVKAEQGKALLWYNHDVDKNTGWIGELDPMSYHGGCDVQNVNKYVANLWINVIGEKGSRDSLNGWFGGRNGLRDEL